MAVYCFLEKLVEELPCSQLGLWCELQMCFLFCSYQEKPQFLHHLLPLYQARMTSAALPPILGLTVCRLSLSALPSALVSGLEWDQGQGALGSLGSLHFCKTQMKELWCGIQQSLSSDHTHSHGLHRPSSGPVFCRHS